MIPFETAQRITNNSLFTARKENKVLCKSEKIIDKEITKACKLGLNSIEFRIKLVHKSREFCNQVMNLLDTQYSIQGYDFKAEYYGYSYTEFWGNTQYLYDIYIKWDKNYYQEHKDIESREDIGLMSRWKSKSLDELFSVINKKQ